MAQADSSDRIPRWRTIIFVLSGTGLLLATLVLYIQTQHAFKHLIVPLVERFIPGQLEIQNGSISFPAGVDLTAVSYRVPETGLFIQSDRFLLRVSAIALVRHRELLIEDLILERGEVRITRESKPTSGTDLQTEASGNESMLLLPGTVQRLRVNGLSILIQTDSRTFTASNVALSMEAIGPGKTGTIDLHGDVTYEDLTSKARWNGDVLVNGTIEQTPARDRITWNATNEVILQEWPQSRSPAGSKPITIHHSLSGTYDVSSATVSNSSSVDARYGSDLLSEFSLEFTRTARPGGAIMDVGLEIKELAAEALNLALPEEESIRIRSTHLGGHANIHAEGDRYTTAFAMTGRHLQAVSGANATPPLDIEIQQAGAADFGANVLSIERFQLRVVENDEIRLMGDIGRPLRISLGRDVADSDHVAVKTTQESEGTLAVSRVDILTLRRWSRVFGVDTLQEIHAGQFNGTLTLSSGRNGRAINGKGNVTLSDVVIAGSDNRATMEPITYAHEFHGTVINLATLQLESYRLTATVKGRTNGVVRLSGMIDLKEPMSNSVIKGSLNLVSLPGQTLNPLLARWTDARFAHAIFSGTADVDMSGGVVGWSIDLKGRRISLRLADTTRATSPTDLTMTQAGRFDKNTGVLELNTLRLQEFERSRPIVTVALDNPVRLTLPGQGADRTLPRMEIPAVVLTLNVSRLGIEQLRPRLSLWKSTALDHVQTGVIDARLKMAWTDESSSAAITGALTIGNLRMSQGELRIREALQLHTTFDAIVKDLSVLQLQKMNIRTLAGSALIAEAGMKGSANLNDASLDLAVTFNAGSLPALVSKIGVIDDQQLNIFASGNIMADGQVTTLGRDRPLSVQATVHSRHLQFQPQPRLTLAYALLARGALEINAERTAIEFKPVDLTLEAAGKPAGSVTLNGTWPIAPSETEASVHLVAKNLDGGPLAELSGSLPGRIPSPLPVDADVTVALDAHTGRLILRGLETIGPMRVARTDGGPEVATLRIEHDVIRGPNQIQIDNLRVTANRPRGVPDDITTTGRIGLNHSRGGRFTGHVASLDAGWYAALFSNPKSSLPPESPAPSVKQPAGQEASSHGATALMGFDIDLSIDSISHGPLKIGPGRLTSQGAEEQRHVTLEPTGVAGGRVEAALDIDARKELPEIRWSGKGQDLSVETILAALSPGQEPALKGSGSFETSGNGVLADGPLRDHLTGTAEITIAKGQFIQSRALSFLAKYTKISELEQMGFDQYRSTLHFSNGAITVDQLSVTGPIASFDGTGSIAQDNAIDVRIFAKIGPSLSARIKIPCMSALLATADGFTTLPFALRITGAADSPKYGIDTAALDYAKGPMTGLVGTMKSLLSGCREDSQESLSK
ncbi:MAG: AsmA-like C-terminal region-containing protein [Nitrospira sp.]|nr:AsmA-like C-terminal region-containing protein [Nitrospira sp.]MDH4355702.1 AsmA-like C-terminal region-containing protein [Nitrospira sp.]